MNKRGEFSWGLFIVCIVVGSIIALLIFGITTSVNNQMDKYERICEKKGMEYFDYNHPAFNDIEVICLDDNGTQIGVKLK